MFTLCGAIWSKNMHPKLRSSAPAKLKAQVIGRERVGGQSRDLFDSQLRSRNGVDADTNPSAPMVMPQLWNCQPRVSECWCGQSRCCWLWEPSKEKWRQSLMTLPFAIPQAAPFLPDPDPHRGSMPSTCVTSNHRFSSSSSPNPE